MPDKRIGPWPLGIDMISDDSATPAGALREALNVDIDKDGVIFSAPIPRSLSDGDMDSLYTSNDLILAAEAGIVYTISPDDGSRTALFTMNSADPVTFTDMLDGIVVMNRTTLALYRNGQIAPLGMDKPASPALVPSASGGLYEGRYAVGITTFNDQGEESALSELAFVDVPAGGGITVNLPATDQPFFGIYRTSHNGDMAYFALKAPAMSQYLLGSGTLGRATDSQFMTRMVPGRIARVWNGRLLIAKGKLLIFSEPMRYGITSPRHNFVVFPHRVTMVEPVDGGVFIGTRAGVVFLAGGTPSEWAIRDTGGKAPIPYASIGMETGELNPDATANVGNGKGAIWLAENGFVVGLPSGNVIESQRTRIRGISGEAGAIAVVNRRVRATVGG
jgi:hypothetical protein